MTILKCELIEVGRAPCGCCSTIAMWASWQDARDGKDPYVGLVGEAYLHDSLRPLEEVDLSTPRERGQPDLMGNECEGMCGV